MSDSNHPVPLAEIREIAKREKLRRVVVVFEQDVGDGIRYLGVTSYGATRALCASARRLADQFYEDAEEFLMEHP